MMLGYKYMCIYIYVHVYTNAFHLNVFKCTQASTHIY